MSVYPRQDFHRQKRKYDSKSPLIYCSCKLAGGICYFKLIPIYNILYENDALKYSI